MRTAVVFLALFSVGLGVSRSVAHSGPTVPARSPPIPSTEVTRPAPSASDCSGGPEAALDVTLRPEAVERANGSEVLVASVRVRNRTAQPATVGYSVEIVSDVGNEVMRVASAARRIDGAGELPRAQVRTPAELRNGFYQARLVARSQGEDGEVELMDHLYFEVRDRNLAVLEADEWYARSRINEGVAQ